MVDDFFAMLTSDAAHLVASKWDSRIKYVPGVDLHRKPLRSLVISIHPITYRPGPTLK